LKENVGSEVGEKGRQVTRRSQDTGAAVARARQLRVWDGVCWVEVWFFLGSAGVGQEKIRSFGRWVCTEEKKGSGKKTFPRDYNARKERWAPKGSLNRLPARETL